MKLTMFREGTDRWEYEVGLAQQAKLDLEPFVSEQSLIRRELAKKIVSRFRFGKGCAIINGSVNWGYAREGSDIDICYYPDKYNPRSLLGKLVFGPGKEDLLELHKYFHNKFRDYGYKSEPIGPHNSIEELREYLASAKKTREVQSDLMWVLKLAKTGIIIGSELEDILAETEEVRKSLNPEQLKQARLDRLFRVLGPVESSIKKFIKILESEEHTIPKSVLFFRDYMERY